MHRHRAGVHHVELAGRSAPVAAEQEQVGAVGAGDRAGPADAGRCRPPRRATRRRRCLRSQRRPRWRPGPASGSTRSARSGAASAVVSTSGSGRATRPASSSSRHQVDQPEPEPALLLGDGEADHAEVGEGRPPGGPGRGRVVGGPEVGGGALLGQDLADRVPELESAGR